MAYDGTLRFDTSVDTSGFQKDANKLGGIVKGLGVFKLLEKGFQAVASSIDGAVSRYDTLNRFPKIMEQMGYGAETAKVSIEKLFDGIQELPTTLDDIVTCTQRLAIVTGSLDKGTESALALNNAFFASGASSEKAARGSEQYIQALSKGKPDMMEWKTLLDTMPYALQKVAEAFGYTGTSAVQNLGSALKDGEITMAQFNDKIIELNGGVGGFAEIAKTATGGIRTAWTNLKTAMVRGTTEIISSIDSGLSETRFKSIENVINSMKDGIYKALCVVADVAGFAARHIDTLAAAAVGVGAAFGAYKGIKAWNAAAKVAANVANNLNSSKKLLILSIGKSQAAIAKETAERLKQESVEAAAKATSLQAIATKDKKTASELAAAAAAATGAKADELQTKATIASKTAEQSQTAATAASTMARVADTAATEASKKAQDAQNASVGIGTAVIGYLTGSLTIHQLATAAATAATTIFGAALRALPLIGIVTAIGLVVTGIIKLIQWFGRSSAAYNEEKQKLKEVREEQENYASALRETQSEARKDAQEKMAQAQQNRVLLETLANLVNENGKCKGSLEDVRRAVNDVNSNIDGLGVTLDETTGCINMSSEALREYGKNLEAVAKYEAAQDQYNIMLKERSEQQAKLNALKEQEAIYVQMFYDEKINRKELNALIDETNERIKEQEKIMSGLEVEVESYERAAKNAYDSEAIIAERRTRIINGQSALVAQYAHQYGLSFEQILNEASKMEGGLEEWQEKIAGRMTESGMDVGMLAKKWGMTVQEVNAYCTQWAINYDDFNELMKGMHTEAGEDVDALASIWGVSANEIREWIAMNESDVQGWSDMMEKAWDEYEKVVEGHTEGVINSFKEIPAKSEISADQMIKILKKNRERYAKWQKNIAQISSMVSAETLAELEKLGPGANSALEDMMKNGGAKLKQFDEEIRKTVEGSTSYASGSQGFHDPRFINAPADAIGQSADAIRDGKTLPAAAQNKVRETKTAMSEAVQSADFLSIGKAIMDGIIAAMDGKATALYAKAHQIANRVAGTMRDALAVRSPSRVMIDIYNNVMMGVYKGMEGMEGKLYRKADSISTGIADRLRIDPRAVTSFAGRLKTLTQIDPFYARAPVYAAAGAPGSINYSTNLTQHITSPTPLSPSRITQEAQDLLKRSKWLLP